MLWKKSDNLKVNIAPATSRLIFTAKKFTEDVAHFGVEKGKTLRYEFGAAVNAYAKFDLMDNMTLENTLNLYSNYLDKPGNVDIDYTFNLMMKVNDYISASLVFQTIYDDDAVKAFQIREAFGAGTYLQVLREASYINKKILPCSARKDFYTMKKSSLKTDK